MNLHSQHLATILKVYPKAILTPIILGKVSSACSEVSKEYAKGFAKWTYLQGYRWNALAGAWTYRDSVSNKIVEMTDEQIMEKYKFVFDTLQSNP